MKADRFTLLAFVGIFVLGGVNGTAIRIGDRELAPLWYAALRFGLASLILFAIVALRRTTLPRGRQLVGSLLYGSLSFGVTFGLVNWGLVTAPAGLAQVILALVPLLTLLFAVAQGLEKFRLQGVAGSALAITGVVFVFAERLGSDVPLPALLALLGAAVSISLANVIVKRFPHAEPTANNAVAMAVGAFILAGVSLAAGERQAVPVALPTLLALGYLAVVGSVIVFTLYLVVIERWTASATSYSMLLMPLVAIVVAWFLLGEPITLALIVGGALVLGGVYIGAFAPSLALPLPGLMRHPAPAAPGAMAATEQPGPPVLLTPNCP
jgi:drug/metabolite transporter (DMT)-like permease